MKVQKEINLIRRFGWNEYKIRTQYFFLIKLENFRKNWLFRHYGPKGSVVVNVLGNDMLLQNDYGISRDLFLDRIREPIATAHVLKTLSPDDIVLEVGANIGYYALMESKICKKVYAVEAVSTNVECLNKNVALNQCKNVEVFELALGDAKGIFPMYLSSKSNWHSFKAKPNKTINVKMDTADNFLVGKDKVSFVRMDVEGYEVNILRGMIKTLANVKRVFIELHTHIISHEEVRECLDLLQSCGFEPELIINCDRSGLGRILPNERIKDIHDGFHFGAYEIFFIKTN
ncbi:MAG: FkbM family methyltransferase, partial [Syntrophales bacterium LBB04]|nr:FkbM family methyltransferase [Syntrophales bacterium LBB04]